MNCAKNDTACEKAEHAAEAAADRAVKKVFAILGVDIDKPESVEEFREDLRFGKRMRKWGDRGMLTIVSALFAAMAYAAWSGIVKAVKGG